MNGEKRNDNNDREIYKKAVMEAKKEFSWSSFKNVTINQNLQADGATKMLAEALVKQSEVDAANSLAMLELAKSLKPIDVCAIKMTNDTVRPVDFGTIPD